MRRISKLINRGILPWSNAIINAIDFFFHNSHIVKILKKECVSSVTKEKLAFKQLTDRFTFYLIHWPVGVKNIFCYKFKLLKSFSAFHINQKYLPRDKTDRVSISQVANLNYLFYALHLTTYWSLCARLRIHLYTYSRPFRNQFKRWSMTSLFNLPPLKKIKSLQLASSVDNESILRRTA